MRNWILFAMLLPALSPAHAQKVAEALAGVPIRLAVRASTATPAVGQKLELIVTLLDGDGRPAMARSTVQCAILVRTPSSGLTNMEETLKAGASSDTQEYTPRAVGRYAVEVIDKAKRLQMGATSFYVFPRSVPKRSALPPKWWMEAGEPRWLAAKPPPPVDQIVTRRPNKAKLSVGYAAGEAGGADAVNISVAYDDDNGGGAPEDIRVWFRYSTGEIDKRPLVIPRGGQLGEAVWTSKLPVPAVTIDYVAPKERFDVDIPAANTFHFVPPVVRLAAFVPPTISILDKPDMTVHFVDGRGNSVRSDRQREVTFTVMQSGVTVSPTKQSVAAGEGPIQVKITPASLGTAKIKIDSIGLNSDGITVAVEVGIGSLIYLSLLGGLAGGGLAFVKDRRNLPLKLLGGIAGGFVLAATYVFGLAPLSSAILTQNAVAAFAISLVGGWAGFAVIDWTWSKLSKA